MSFADRPWHHTTVTQRVTHVLFGSDTNRAISTILSGDLVPWGRSHQRTTLTTGPRAIVQRANGLCGMLEGHRGTFSLLRTASRKNAFSHTCLQNGMLARCWMQQRPDSQLMLTTSYRQHAGECISCIPIRQWYIEWSAQEQPYVWSSQIVQTHNRSHIQTRDQLAQVGVLTS